METKQKEKAIDFLELATQINYFTKLKSINKNENVLAYELQISSYSELNQKIASLLKTSIKVLENETSDVAIDVMLLLEMAVQLLPSDEMEFLDEVFDRKGEGLN